MPNPASLKKKKTSDWADFIALKIMADAHSYSFNEAASLIADRLRCVRQEGELAGMRNVLDQLRIDELLAKLPTHRGPFPRILDQDRLPMERLE